MKRRGLQSQPLPGTKVRLTGYFLRCTGQVTGSEGQSRWIVVACACSLCKTGDYIATDEPSGRKAGEGHTQAELDSEPGLAWRHFAIGNLQIVGAAPRAADQPEECPPIKRYG